LAIVQAKKQRNTAWLVEHLGIAADFAIQLGDLQRALMWADEAAALVRTHGYWGELDYAFGPLSEAAVLTHRADSSKIIAEAKQHLDASEHHLARPQVLRAEGLWTLERGKVDAAQTTLQASADLARSQHVLPQLGRSLAVLKDLLRRRDDAARAEAINGELAEIVQRIGPAVVGLAWASPSPPKQSSSVEGLTKREWEVAALLARGWTNRQIADALVIAEGTAGVHVDHILNKLGFHSRAQVVRWATERGLLEK